VLLQRVCCSVCVVVCVVQCVVAVYCCSVCVAVHCCGVCVAVSCCSMSNTSLVRVHVIGGYLSCGVVVAVQFLQCVFVAVCHVHI